MILRRKVQEVEALQERVMELKSVLGIGPEAMMNDPEFLTELINGQEGDHQDDDQMWGDNWEQELVAMDDEDYGAFAHDVDMDSRETEDDTMHEPESDRGDLTTDNEHLEGEPNLMNHTEVRSSSLA